MLQTELETNCSNMAANNVAKTDKQANIVKRLEELSKWQEEQKKLLEVRQALQRQMLNAEQRTMYQMLGLHSESEMNKTEEVQSDAKEGLVDKVFENFDDSADENLKNVQLNAEGANEMNNKDIEPVSCRTLTSGYETELCTELQDMKPKRPFLKRGEGLKQRFKIHPDELRLNNLPKYKYANAHSRPRQKLFNKIHKTKSSNQANLNPINKEPAGHTIKLDAQEQRFQNLLISSKNTCSSTPDTKSSITTNKKHSTKAKCKSGTSENVNIIEKKILPPKLSETQFCEVSKAQPTVTHIVAWSKILNPLEIQPLQVPRKCTETLPQTEESIFELLEQKANEGSFNMNSTCLKEFMSRKITETEQLNESDDAGSMVVHEYLKNKRLEPIVSATSQEPYYCTSDKEESQLTEDVECTESDETTHKTIETTNTSYPEQTPKVRVRFSDSNETHEYVEESEPYDNSCLSVDTTQKEIQSETTDDKLFAEFKQAFFAALQIKADQHLASDCALNSASDITLMPTDLIPINNICEDNNSIFSPACKDLQEKTAIIKTRLAELEKEIQSFKENNLLLMKAKQDHELVIAVNAQQHLEAMESLKDEKIKMEIYLHDERVKLEDEKRQLEQNIKMKMQGVIAKERKECERLKDQLKQLEMQLKSKESNHTSAQARLRTQIRNLEREQRKLHEQIENLTRDNKRLENENLKISREQNNKILLEINRNIAKLAPKQIQNPSYSIPEEGPPTLGSSRTASKYTTPGANANKNADKEPKTTKFSYAKQVNGTRKSLSPNCEDAEIAAETRIVEQKKQYEPQQNYISDYDEEDDILKEFQTTPKKRNNIISVTQKNDNNKSPNGLLSKDQSTKPVPPPPSPRLREGCNNNSNMKREIINADGSKDIWYPNGNLKKISADGMIIRMLYYNKDIKETDINEGTVKYYYNETNTWHTTYLDGLEILEFPNGQVEHRHKSGLIEVHYPNNSVKITDPKDEHKQEEWRFPDGTHLVQMHNGNKILSLPNGQKEIHNKLHKRREYPDGTVKIVYPDGSTETRYSNGRIRLKDKEGKLVMDTDMAK